MKPTRRLSASHSTKSSRQYKGTHSQTRSVTRSGVKRARSVKSAKEREGEHASAASLCEITQPRTEQTCEMISEPPAPSPHKPTEKEKAYLARHAKRAAGAPPAMSYKYEADHRGDRIEINHPDPVVARQVLMETIGTANSAFVEGFQQQLMALADFDAEREIEVINFILSVVVGSQPQDELEAMHFAQMGAHQWLLMESVKDAQRYRSELRLRRNNRGYPSRIKPGNPFEQENDKYVSELLACEEMCYRAVEKVSRAYAAHLLALPRYRIFKTLAAKGLESENIPARSMTAAKPDANGSAQHRMSESKVVQLHRR